MSQKERELRRNGPWARRATSARARETVGAAQGARSTPVAGAGTGDGTKPNPAIDPESLSNNPGVGPRPSEDKPGEERRRPVSAERYGEEARRSQAQPQPADASRDHCSGSEPSQEVVERADRVLVFARAYFDEVRATRSINVPRTEILVDRCLELVEGEAPPLLRGFARPLDGNITAPHAVLVTQLCAHIARSLEWDEESSRELVLAGFLHDIGMVFVEDKALWSSRPLSEKVRKKIQSHTRIGCALIAGTREWSLVVSNVARDHHERWNGSGYPCGTKGTETGFQARLLGLLDTYAALVTPRPHRSALDPTFARERLGHAMRLGLFDPSLRAVLEETLGNLPFRVAEPRGAERRPPLTRNSIELRGELVTMLAKGST